MYDARAVKVMIATPSDVRRERQEVREILHEWNAVNSERMGLVLMPVGWDSHSAPELGDRAQEIINRTVLDGCDLLVAVFWTRLGTPTGKAESGTAEEIERHVAADKPAMLYFSDAPAAPSTIDAKQHAALLAFKAKMQTQGLVQIYSEPSDFAGKFRRELALTIPRRFAGPEAVEADSLDLSTLGGQRDGRNDLAISSDAKILLLEAARDAHGNVLKSRTMSGTGIHTNGKTLNIEGDRRSEARWEAALDELINLGAIEPQGYKGEIFAMTHVGYRLADHFGK